MPKNKNNKTYLPLPDTNEVEPPTTGDGFWFTDALDENDTVAARQILVAQFDIPPDQIAHLLELFENPASPGNMTRHRLEIRQRKRGALSKEAKAADFLPDLTALNMRHEKGKLEALLLPTSAAGIGNPYILKIIPRKPGRRLKTHKVRVHEFTTKLRFQRNPQDLVPKDPKPPQGKKSAGQGAQAPEMMKQIIAKVGDSLGWRKSKVYKVIGLKKKQFKPRAK